MKTYEGLYLTEYEIDWNTKKPTIWLFSRLKNGEKKIEKIKDFAPYFYVEKNTPLGDDAKIYKSIFNEEVKKITLKSPKDIYPLRQQIEERGFKHYEADILYNNRFLIDEVKEIIPSIYKIFYIDIETLSENGFPNVDEADQPIICLTIYNSFSKKYISWIWRKDFLKEVVDGISKDNIIKKFSREEDMLQDVINYIRIEQPDVITGWNSTQFDMKYLLNRMKNIFDLNIRDLSPMKTAFVTQNRPGTIAGKEFKGVPIIKGIVLFDLLYYYRKVHKGELSSYSLNSVAIEELGEEKTDSHHVVDKDWRSDWMNVIKYNKKDVELCVKIDEKTGVFSFFDQMRTIAHCNISDCKFYGRLVDIFILRFSKERNIVLPSKKPYNSNRVLEGGYVMEPNIGLHKNVIVIDLNSAYPNLINTFNLSAETRVDDGEININGVRFTKKFKGLIPSVIDELNKLRTKFQSKMKELRFDDPEFKIYDMKNQSSKNLVCTLYGKNAESTFRLSNDYVAQTITYLGRELIKWVKKQIEDEGYTIIAGDSVTEDMETIIYEDKKIKFKTFKELSQKLNFKKINNKEIYIPKNLKTLVADNDLKLKIRPIKKIIRHQVNKPIYHIKCAHEYNIKVTDDHSIMILDDMGNLKETKAKDLKQNDYILTNNKIKRLNIQSKNFNKEFYEFFGLWIADGSISNFSMCISSADVEGHQLIKKFCKQQKINCHLQKNKMDFSIGSSKFGKRMEELGFKGKSSTKRIPKWMFNETEKNICHFLRGMFSGDGLITGVEVVYNTINMDLAKDVQKLLKISNILSTINISKTPNFYPDKKQNKIYSNGSLSKRVVIHKLSIKKFVDKISFIIERKNDKLKIFINHIKMSLYPMPKRIINYIYNTKWRCYQNTKCLSHYNLLKLIKDKNVNYKDKKIIKKIINGDLYFVKIKNIEKLNKKQNYVYDLEIDKNHNFFANQILVHNTDSCIVKLPDIMNMQKCIETGKFLVNKINNNINDFVVKYGVKNECSLGISLEKLFKNYLLVAKKHYAGHVVWKDGKEDDAIKIIGIGAIRSDNSKVSKLLQKTLLEMILRNNPKQEIIDYVKDIINNIKTKSYTDIAIPVKFEKSLDEYKTNIPRVRGAKWSNINLNTNYNAGNKVLMLYTKGESDCVCFEDDYQMQKVLKEKNIKIDYAKMIDKLIIMKIRRIFETLNWDVEVNKMVASYLNNNKTLDLYLQ